MLSPIFKWLERRFLPKLQNYLSTRLDPNQTGFVPGMGTSVNILLLINRLRSIRKRQGECCIFIDYKSAYNTVNRQRLYRILKEKNVLNHNEVDFLQGLHDALHFRQGDRHFYLKNGVHQGSPISPALFNVYMEDVMAEVTKRCTFSFWYKLYADDLVMTVSHQYLEILLATLHEISCEYDLKVNPKKCAILAIKKHNKIREDMDLKGIPVATEYCYLGVNIDHSGCIGLQINFI